MSRAFHGFSRSLFLAAVLCGGMGRVSSMAADSLPVINEFLADNTKTLTNSFGDYDDWLEIYNPSSTATNMAGWHLTDDAGDLGKWTFPTGGISSLAGKGYLVVWADGKSYSVTNNELHANFKISAGGEYLALVGPTGNVVYSYVPQFPEQYPDISYGIGDGGQQRYFGIPTPGASNDLSVSGEQASETRFDIDRGLFTNAIQVAITSDLPGVSIRYTRDFKVPTNGSTLYTVPLSISSSTVIRAAAFKTGYVPSDVDTHTYITIQDVLLQPASPSGFPTMWTNRYGWETNADYQMDPAIVASPTYNPMMTNAMKALPSIFITTPKDNLFGSTNGIYINSFEEGMEWERPASVEWVRTNNTTEFQIDCGLRISGHATRSYGMTHKKSFNIRFRGEYGAGRLNSDPFDDPTCVNSFNELAIRSGYCDAWCRTGGGGHANTQYLIDEFVRRSHLAMGDVALHGNFAHVYLNGLYWGIYNISEKASPEFATAYCGGNEDNWDVLVSSSTGAVGGLEAPQGTVDAWNAMKYMLTNGPVSNVVFRKVQGNNPDGTRNPAYPVYLDLDNYIDYVIAETWCGNLDWPGSNEIIMRDRDDAHSTGFKFILWDVEAGMGTWLEWPGPLDPCYTDRTWRNDGVMQVQLWLTNGPCAAEYRLRFADRIQKHLFNDGALTTASTIPRYTAMANAFEPAVVAESARWGDQDGVDYTLAHWQTRRNWMTNTYLPVRTSAVLEDFKNVGLFPSLDAPVLSQNGGVVSNGYVLTMTAAKPIYYTLDGTDPRQFGTGQAAGTLYTNAVGVPITRSTLVKARAMDTTNLWSALSEAVFVLTNTEQLCVTEVMYHPRNPTGTETNASLDADDFEFIELQNTGSSVIGLAGVKFSGGVKFEFSDGTVPLLNPGEYVLVVGDIAAFTNRYTNCAGMKIAGEFIFPGENLDNAGEEVVLENGLGVTLASFIYNDSWHIGTDGAGHSLVPLVTSNQAVGVLDYSGNWRASAYIDGSPGMADQSPVIDVLLNEIMAHTDYTNDWDSNDWIELYNTLATQVSLTNWYLSDDADDLRKWAIPGTNVIGAQSWKTFFEVGGFHPATNIGFGLDKAGEQVFLSYLPGDTNNRVADGVRFKGQANGYSLGRYPDGGSAWYSLPSTTNMPNTSAPPQHVLISEIMYHPFPTAANPEDNQNDEFIELYNPTASPVTLMNSIIDAGVWRIGGDVQYLFPSNTTLSAGGRLVLVSFDPVADTNSLAAFVAVYGPTNVQAALMGPYSGRLSNRGGRVALEKPLAPDLAGDSWSWVIVDEVNYLDSAPWPPDADGTGRPIQRTDESGSGDQPDDWEAGLLATPGRARATYNEWPYRMKITLSGYDRPETLTNFPALVVLNTNIPGFGYGQFWSPLGWDRRLFDSSGTNPVLYEVEEWNTNGNSCLWVLVPRISGSTSTVWMYWGQSNVSSWAYCVTNGEVWSAGYDLVMHMSATNGANALDATANNRTGMIYGAYAWQPGGGQVGGALRMTGDFTNDKIVLPAARKVQLGSQWTISSWFKNLRAAGTTRVLASGDGGEIQVDVRGAQSRLSTYSSTKGYWSGTNLVVPSGEWHHLAAVGIGTKTLFYVDGIHVGTNSDYRATNDVRYIGNSTNAYKFAEYLDEFRISSVGRSTNWIWAEWMNQASNSAFATYMMILPGWPDVDADGMADSWEMIHFFATNATDCGPLEDKDKDGYLNKWEYIAGTDPTNKESVFEVDIIYSNGVPTVRFYARSVGGVGYEDETKTRYYDLEDRTNMLGVVLDWAGVLNKTNISGNDSYVEQTNPPSATRRFFRARARLE